MLGRKSLSGFKYVAYSLGLFSCHGSQQVPLQLVASELSLRCAGPRMGLPGGKIYRCSVSVEAGSLHRRWLILPDYAEDKMKFHGSIDGLEVIEKRAGVPLCYSVMGDVAFQMIPLLPKQPLHLPEWVLRTWEDQKRVTVWLGEDLPLSTGNTLGNVCGSLLAQKRPQGLDPPRPKWTAPQGTTVELAPNGFRSLDIRPLAPW